MDDYENELKETQQKISAKENEQIGILKGITRTLDDTESCGIEINKNLYGQGEKLKKIHENVLQIDKDVSEAEEDVIKIRSNCCTYWFKKRFKMKKKKPKETDYIVENNSSNKLAEKPKNESNSNSNKHFTYSSEKTENKFLTRQDEYDKELDEIDGYLARIKGIAIDQGEELDKQNEFLDPFVEDVKDLTSRVDKLDKELKKELFS